MSPLRVALGVSAVYAAYAVAAFAMQRTVMFPGYGMPGRAEPPADAERLWLSLPEGRVEAWLLPARGVTGPSPVVVFAHGNAELIDDWAGGFEFLRDQGLAVMLVEYPGYGRSAGRPSERSVAATMKQALEVVRAEPRLDAGRVVLFGRSLGGGAVCTQLDASPPAALVLQSSFASLRPFASAMLLPSFILRDRFDNEAAVRRYPGQVLVLHGRRDEVIPFRHGERLARAARHSRFVELDCGHNDCLPSDPRIATPLLAFLRDSGVL